MFSFSFIFPVIFVNLASQYCFLIILFCLNMIELSVTAICVSNVSAVSMSGCTSWAPSRWVAALCHSHVDEVAVGLESMANVIQLGHYSVLWGLERSGYQASGLSETLFYLRFNCRTKQFMISNFFQQFWTEKLVHNTLLVLSSFIDGFFNCTSKRVTRLFAHYLMFKTQIFQS